MQLFYSNPNRSFYVREITRKIDEQINSVRRELANLLSIGIISSDTSDNRLYYEVNQKYEHYNELASIFGVKAAAAPEKTENTIDAVDTPDTQQESEEIAGIKKVGNIELALFSGKFTRDESAGVDVLIVGDVNKTKTAKYIAELEAKEGKELRYVIMPVKEFQYRKQVNDRFITTLLHSKTQVLIDKNSVLN